jgi:hypothetical protein
LAEFADSLIWINLVGRQCGKIRISMQEHLRDDFRESAMATETETANLMLQMPFGGDLQQATMKAQANLADGMRQGSQTFWQQQTELLQSMESFANGWFERRKVGVQAACQAADRMCQAATPQACISEYQKWAIGVAERVMADAVACQCEFGKFVQAVGPSPASATSGGQQAGAEPRKRSLASAA